MATPEITLTPPWQPDLGGIAERALTILPPILAVALLFGIAYYGLKTATSPAQKRG